MKIVHTIKEAREQINLWKKKGYCIGFVPTMGYLHDGHQSLIQKAVQENDKVVVSIFVNPMQFAPSEDLQNYPRDLLADTELCENVGADMIFNPSNEEMYPKGFYTFVDVDKITEGLCGKSRPTHFRGVCTVVNKLFNIIKPNRAYFGQKDAQQLAVIKRMVTDLDMDIEIIGCPIVREIDGLAKSSRNTYLSTEERNAALILSKAINEGERLLIEGKRNTEELIAKMKVVIESEPLAKIDYIEVVDGVSMEKLDEISDKQSFILVALAVFIGKTRLIDNFIYTKAESS